MLGLQAFYQEPGGGEVGGGQAVAIHNNIKNNDKPKMNFHLIIIRYLVICMPIKMYTV